MNPLRIVIQQIGVYPTPSYRVVVYGDEFKPRHCDFAGVAVLLHALATALPEIDVAQLSLNPAKEGHGSIVFDDEMFLSERQLIALGCKSTS